MFHYSNCNLYCLVVFLIYTYRSKCTRSKKTKNIKTIATPTIEIHRISRNIHTQMEEKIFNLFYLIRTLFNL